MPKLKNPPPTCPLPPGTSAQGIRLRPTSEALRAVAATAAAEPTFLISVEPIPNFGIESFRLANYTDCTSTIGCYWPTSTPRPAAPKTSSLASWLPTKPAPRPTKN